MNSHAVTQLFEIEPGAEGAAGAGQNHDAHGRIGFQRDEGIEQRVTQFERQRVQALRTIERDDGKAVGLVD